MQIDGAIFDLDGTLLDTNQKWKKLAYDYLKTKNRTLTTDVSTMNLDEAAEHFITNYNISETTEQILNEIKEMIREFYIYNAQLKEGAEDFVKYLKSINVKMCIATASDYGLCESALKRVGILNCFDKIFTCSEYKTNKTEPKIYNIAHEYMKSQNTWVFEDSFFAAQTAKKAGFKVCGIYDKEGDAELKNVSDIYLLSFLNGGELFENGIDNSRL